MDSNARPPDWSDLTAELDSWAAGGRVALLWWRDDDADDAPPALLQLVQLGARLEVDLALAVVPAEAGPPLAEALADSRRVTVVQHGWAHRNHGVPGQPAVEVGGTRPVAAVLGELGEGADRLRGLFGPRFDPVLVPPWNRIAPPVVPHLAAAGYRGLSTFGPRSSRQTEPGVAVVNTHVDILRWRGGAHFAGPEKILGQLLKHLRQQRLGSADADEPIGILTHHRDHDPAAWQFLETLLQIVQKHPSARWLSVAQAFAGRSVTSGPVS